MEAYKQAFLNQNSNYHLERHKRQHTFVHQNVTQLQEYASTKKILPQKSDDEIANQPNDDSETDFEKFLQPDDSNTATI